VDEKSVAQAVEEWAATRPPKVAAVVRSHPPSTCYRSIENPGHYTIQSYGEPENGTDVTLTILHGADSYAPGISVFGVQPGTLSVCGCGRWSWPTEEQGAATMAALKARAPRGEA